MDKITIEVNAVPAENKIESIQVKSEDIQPKAGDLHLISVPKELNIPMKPVKPKYVDSVLHVVRRWNKTQGHFKAEDSEKNQKMSQPEPIREVHTSRLETWLRKTFGAAKKVRTDYAGNVGIIYFYLSRPPEEGENIVVTFGQDREIPVSGWLKECALNLIKTIGINPLGPSSSLIKNFRNPVQHILMQNRETSGCPG